MYRTIKGIVLKKTRFADSSAYITVITETGLEKFSAKGIFSPKSKNASACVLYALSEFVLSTRNEASTLSSASLIKPLIRQGVDFEALAVANYVSTLAHDVTFTEEDAGIVYRLLGTTLATLNRMETSPSVVKAVFELRLMASLGFYPDLDSCARCGKPFSHGWFLPYEGGVLCETCETFSQEERIPLSESMKNGVERLLSISDTAAFGIRFSEESGERAFCRLAEEFSVSHLDCATSALEYYKNNIKNLTELK
ncbi:MAG: DNA repair protein RecO [Clostridia bacterium]|nr:DNA repair protein RecO [Clostridia bacterium]